MSRRNKNLLREQICKTLLQEFKIKQSNIAGRGLFTDSSFEEGERLFPAFWINRDESFTWRRAHGLPISWPHDISWHDLTWNVNHQKSCNVNVEREGDTWYCTAKENIPSGEELTFDYEALPSFCDRDVSDFIEIE
tara:strand:- start:61 stop:468 length:408 start_codon:yes stop_codon:yes gene_type:complete